MSRRFSLSLLVFLVIPLMGVQAQEAPSPVIEGTLVGHDGSALSTSHVHVRPYGNSRTRSLPIGTDRSFRAALDTTGVVQLRFTGRNHKMQETTVLVRPDDSVSVDVRLGTFPVPDSLDLEVMGTFNDFSPRHGAIPMQKRDDGTYVATVPSPMDSLKYAVLGARADGTDLDTLSYAGRGNYRPVIDTPRDSTMIAYNPTAIPHDNTEPMVQFRDTTSAPARYAAFVDGLKARREDYVDAMQEAQDREERKAISDTFDWSPNRKRLERILSEELSSGIKNASRAAYLDNTFDADSIVAKEALNTIPASSPLWSLAGLDRTIRAAGGPDAHEEFAYKALRENPSDEVKSNTLFMLLYEAEQNDEEEKQELLYSWMKAEYEDQRIMDIAQARFSPERTIRPGNAVPDFEVPALRDTTKTFTASSFEGQYVLLDFWATWCGPCIQELPTLRKADSTFGGDDFTILSLSLDDSRSTVTDFLEDREMPWTHAFVQNGFESEVADQFELVGIPKPVLVKPNGQIVATSGDLRGEKLLKTLKEHLAPTADASNSGESN